MIWWPDILNNSMSNLPRDINPVNSDEVVAVTFLNRVSIDMLRWSPAFISPRLWGLQWTFEFDDSDVICWHGIHTSSHIFSSGSRTWNETV
jgi:hypothetical protein